MNTTGFAIKSAVTGGKEAVYSGVQSLRLWGVYWGDYYPCTGGQQQDTSVTNIFLEPQSCSFWELGQERHPCLCESVQWALKNDSDPAEYLLSYILSPISPRMNNHDPNKICQDHVYRAINRSTATRPTSICPISGKCSYLSLEWTSRSWCTLSRPIVIPKLKSFWSKNIRPISRKWLVTPTPSDASLPLHWSKAT